jgi:hypothetical protein
MPTLALRFGLLFVLATSVFYFAAELSSQGAGWAVLLLQSGARALHECAAACLHRRRHVHGLIGLDRLNRQKYP